MARFNFSLDDDSTLERLRQATKRPSKAEVVRDALSVYGYLISLIAEGDRLYVGKTASEVRELVITTLENARISAAASDQVSASR